MGLGAYPLFSLAEARQRAEQWRKLKADGVDPIQTRKAQRTAARLEAAKRITFQQAAEKYVANKSADWHSDKHRYHWGATLRNYAFPIIGNLPVADIDTDAVMRVLQPIWHSKTETASRLRGRIERVLNAAKTQGLRTGENPARWVGHLGELLPKVSKTKRKRHHAFLPYSEVAAFVAELRQQPSTAARALELLILCGVRTGDIVGQKRDNKPPMRWEHVIERDPIDGPTWTIPSTKNDKALRVPLTNRALEIVNSQPRTSDFVFLNSDGTSSLKEAAMRDFLKTMRSGLTVHGFRSSLTTWAHDRAGYSKDICEMVLAHKVGDASWEAYQHGDLLDKRRQLMDAWAAYCERPPVAEGGNVLTMKGRS
jgi:integrase